MGRSNKMVTITLIFSSEDDAYAVESHSVEVFLGKTDSIRNTAMTLLSSLEKAPDYITSSKDKWPMSIRLHGADSSIKYGINQNGSLRLLEWNSSLYYDWTYGELRTLKANGIIDGDINHITIEFLEGLGAPGMGGLEWTSADFFLFIDLLTRTVSLTTAVIKMMSIQESIKTARENGFMCPESIRNVIELKDKWTLRQICKLFCVDDVLGMTYLLGLGFVCDGNKYWIYDSNNPESLRMRAKWIEDEKAINRKLVKQTEVSVV